jgi:hypothetical protein
MTDRTIPTDADGPGSVSLVPQQEGSDTVAQLPAIVTAPSTLSRPPTTPTATTPHLSLSRQPSTAGVLGQPTEEQPYSLLHDDYELGKVIGDFSPSSTRLTT